MWQDYVLAIAQGVFALALLPSILHPIQKPVLLTSLTTAIGMLAVTVTYFSLKLWGSTIAGTILTFEWIILSCQSLEHWKRRQLAANYWRTPNMPFRKLMVRIFGYD